MLRITNDQGLMFSFVDNHTVVIVPLICCFNFLTEAFFWYHRIPVRVINLMVVSILV